MKRCAKHFMSDGCDATLQNFRIFIHSNKDDEKFHSYARGVCVCVCSDEVVPVITSLLLFKFFFDKYSAQRCGSTNMITRFWITHEHTDTPE